MSNGCGAGPQPAGVGAQHRDRLALAQACDVAPGSRPRQRSPGRCTGPRRHRATPPRARRHRCRRTGRGSDCRAAAARPCSRIPNSASRARSLVGRVARPAGVSIRRPRCRPAMIRRLTRRAAPRSPAGRGRGGSSTRAPICSRSTLAGTSSTERLGSMAELERAVGHADQPIDLEPDMLEHPPHLAVLALAQRHGEPGIVALGPVEPEPRSGRRRCRRP